MAPQQDPTPDPLPHLVYNSESEPDSVNELHPDLPWRAVQDIPFSLFPAQGSNGETHNCLLKMTLFLSRILLPLLTLLTTMIGMDSEVPDSFAFHPVDWIYNSISPWILTTAIDFNPYKDALFGINQYAFKGTAILN